MSDSNENNDGKKTLSLKGGTLGLKKSVDLNRVEQKFSHGRTKAVSVERRGPGSATRTSGESMRTARPSADSLRKREAASSGSGKPKSGGNI